MANTLPDPKVLVDSVLDGVVEVAETPARVLENVAKVAETYASDVKSNMDSLKTKLPDNPEAIPEAAIKGIGQTVKAGIGFFEAIGGGIQSTVTALKGQINRVTG